MIDALQSAPPHASMPFRGIVWNGCGCGVDLHNALHWGPILMLWPEAPLCGPPSAACTPVFAYLSCCCIVRHHKTTTTVCASHCVFFRGGISPDFCVFPKEKAGQECSFQSGTVDTEKSSTTMKTPLKKDDNKAKEQKIIQIARHCFRKIGCMAGYRNKVKKHFEKKLN